MAALLKWTEPKQVPEWKWTNEDLPQLRSLKWVWLRWWVILASVCVYIVHRVDPDPSKATRLIPALAACTFAIPAWFYLAVWLQTKSLPRYELKEKGLIKRDGSSSVFYRWEQIQSYSIRDHQGVPGVRVLELILTKRKKPRLWSFDPAELDESRLRELLEHHLPGKCWDNVVESEHT